MRFTCFGNNTMGRPFSSRKETADGENCRGSAEKFSSPSTKNVGKTQFFQFNVNEN